MRKKDIVHYNFDANTFVAILPVSINIAVPKFRPIFFLFETFLF